MDDFLPQDYVAPSTGGQYLKLEKGDTRFRFVSSPITGWVWFTDEGGKKEVHRIKATDPKPLAQFKPKHFWAAVVYDYAAESFKILEIKQATVQAAILGFNKNPKWGNPKEYDICVTRTGDGIETTAYNVMPEPKTSAPEGSLNAVENINLQALYSGADPFENYKK